MDEQFVDPEMLYISACLENGKWGLTADGLHKSNFDSCSRVVHFLDSYAGRHGDVPPLELLNRKFPGFGFIPGVSHMFATSEMHRWIRANQLKDVIAKSASAVKDGELDEAVSMFRQASVDYRRRTSGRSVGDEHVFHVDTADAIPVAGPILNDLTGGIRPGNYWIVVGKTRDGKSWKLMEHAVAAAAAGVKVVYFSLEMPSHVCASRLHTIMVGRVQPGQTRNERRNQVCEWLERHDSMITVVDPADEPVVTPEVVASHADANTLLVVDYAGLMSSSNGQRSIEDWRVAASISNGLQKVALQFEVPLITAMQANRTANTPNINSIGQSIQFAQDADVVHVVTRQAEKVTLNVLEKNRHGTNGTKWYSLFDPSIPDFRDLTTERANELKAAEQAKGLAFQ